MANSFNAHAPIAATMAIAPDSRTPDKASAWKVSCIWNGRMFEAVSRTGASFALCRKLVSAGCPDGPMEVRDPVGHPMLRIPSIYKAAGRTIEEKSKAPIKSKRYRSPEMKGFGVRTGQNIEHSRVPATTIAETAENARTVGRDGTSVDSPKCPERQAA